MTEKVAKKDSRSLFRVLGLILVVAALIFVGLRVAENWETLARWEAPEGLWLLLLVASVAYGVICLLLSTAWCRVLGVLSTDRINGLEAHVIYARSQLAKFIPGNVFHLASRHAMSRRSGRSHGPLVGAALFEAAGLVAAASGLAIAGVFYDQKIATAQPAYIHVLLFAGAVLFPFLLNVVAVRMGVLKRVGMEQMSTGSLVRGLLPAFALYLLFFAAAGAVLVLIFLFIRSDGGLDAVFPVLTVFAVSWIAGYITPGASAGIGVREAVMVGWLGQVVGEADAILIAVLFRIATTVGDVLFFVGGIVVGAITGEKGGPPTGADSSG